jgi:beta-lactamase class A
VSLLPALVLVAAGGPGLAGARPAIEGLIARSGAEVAVAARTLDGKELLIAPDLSFHAASTMKIPVMIALYHEARKKHLSLDEALPVKNAFSSIVDGSPYSLNPESDSDPSLYEAIGSTRPISDLCESMITMSGNLATNLLIERIGLPVIRERVRALKAPGMDVIRGLEDGKAFLAGKNNQTTARALEILLDRLARGKAVDRDRDKAMVEMLKRQHFKDAIPAGLPEGTEVAHKTGEITKIQEDAAIVYARRPFVLVVLVRGLEDRTQGVGLIASIARIVYDATQGGAR